MSINYHKNTNLWLQAHLVTGLLVFRFLQLYNMSPEPERKAFLDKLFDFMQRKGTTIVVLIVHTNPITS